MSFDNIVKSTACSFVSKSWILRIFKYWNISQCENEKKWDDIDKEWINCWYHKMWLLFIFFWLKKYMFYFYCLIQYCCLYNPWLNKSKWQDRIYYTKDNICFLILNYLLFCTALCWFYRCWILIVIKYRRNKCIY